MEHLTFGDYFVLFIGPLIGPVLALLWMLQAKNKKQVG